MVENQEEKRGETDNIVLNYKLLKFILKLCWGKVLCSAWGCTTENSENCLL